MRFTALVVLACCALVSRGAAASARHLRFSTANGPVHVYIPDGYDRARAGTVIYVHGFFANVDQAWNRYHLADQFAASGLDALFIACEAPTSGDDPVAWPSLADLLSAVREHLGEPLPPGPIVAVGHSGAHITLRGWLAEPQLDTVVLLDALYGEVEEFKAWLEASNNHRLIDVGGGETRAWTEQLHARFPESVVLDGLPAHLERLRSARIVYIRADVDHMDVIEGGVVLPKVLRALRLPELRRPRPRASGSAS
jgi:hypothetical protein